MQGVIGFIRKCVAAVSGAIYCYRNGGIPKFDLAKAQTLSPALRPHAGILAAHMGVESTVHQEIAARLAEYSETIKAIDPSIESARSVAAEHIEDLERQIASLKGQIAALESMRDTRIEGLEARRALAEDAVTALESLSRELTLVAA